MLRLLAAVLVLPRLLRGRRLPPPLAPGAPALTETVSVVVPARDEEARIAGVLAPLRDEPGVTEVIVVDDESTDRTAEVAAAHGATVLAGRPLPDGWAGKAWALQQGLEAARGEWVVFLDADTLPERGLIAALVDRARSVELLSAGPRFVCDTDLERALHAAFLATLVWRFGPDDGRQRRPSRVVFNGQCVVARRDELLRRGGWARVRSSLVEDVALARAWRRDGARLAFVDAADLLAVRMYGSARETWHGWGRSLMAADETPLVWTLLDLLVIWEALGLALVRRDRLFLALRLLVLPGLARAYRPRGPGFWLSPLADLPVAIRLTWSVLRPGRTWRGRSYAPGRARRSGT